MPVKAKRFARLHLSKHISVKAGEPAWSRAERDIERERGR